MLTAQSHDRGGAVFDQVGGLPVHALILHAAVVLIPLLALGAIVYAVVPRWRPRIGWAIILLAIITPVTALVTMESGQKLFGRLLANGVSGRGKEILDQHMRFGTLTFWFTLALGVVTLVMVLFTQRRSARLPRTAHVGLAVIMVALAAISGYYCFRTGDSGAHAVWGRY
jgi:MFS superfamily sulfate permease-like transporter